MVVPRAAERGNGVAVNALGFAGTMLVRRMRLCFACPAPHARIGAQVRSTEELERVRKDPMGILAEAGFPW